MYTARLKLPAHLSQQQAESLSLVMSIEACASVVVREKHRDTSPWILEWVLEESLSVEGFYARAVLAADLQGQDIEVSKDDCTVEALPDRDWLSYSYQQFPSFSVGPFFIYGAHHDGDIPVGQMGLQIDAATAFGSGEHGTTKGCLQAMLDLKAMGVCPWNVLDMGTGSGILAIASWKLWKTAVLAVDNDAEAVRVSEHHQQTNKIPQGGSNMVCAVSEGFSAEIVEKKAPYELVIANIQAGPLKDMAADLYKTLDDNGYVILSGILHQQAASVLEAYTAQGLSLRKRYEIDEWSTLLLHNTPA